MKRFATSDTRERVLELRKQQPTTAEVIGAQVEAAVRSRRGRAAAQRGDVVDDAGEDDDVRGAVMRNYDYASAYAADDAHMAATQQQQQSYGGKSRKAAATAATTTHASAPLRRRGPLDEALSQGRYAATPVRVEAAVDDLFSALDMRDLDAEDDEEVTMDGGDEHDGADGAADEAATAATTRTQRRRTRDDDDDDDGAQQPRRRVRRAKDLNEAEYTAWLEAKLQRRRRRQGDAHDDEKDDHNDDDDSGRVDDGGSEADDAQRDDVVAAGRSSEFDDEEARILQQLAAVRRAQRQHGGELQLVHGGDAAAAADDGDGGGTSLSSAATLQQQRRREQTQGVVRYYYMLYTQLLRLRVKLQPAVIKAVSLPQYYAYPLFTQGGGSSSHAGDDEVTSTAARAYAEVRTQLLDTLASLRACAASMHKSSNSNNNNDDKAKTTMPTSTRALFDDLTAFHTRTRTLADAALEYWGGKLLVVRAGALKAVAQPLPQQIRAILAVRSRLRAKVQRNRAHLRILGHPQHLRLHTLRHGTSLSSSQQQQQQQDDATHAASDTKGRDDDADEAAAAAAAERAAAQRALHIAEGDGDAEVYDDGDFVRELVHRGGGAVRAGQQLQEQLASVQHALQSTARPSRKGFHRLTKGKTVNYEPMPALVGFCVAEAYDGSGRNDVVVSSLFQ